MKAINVFIALAAMCLGSQVSQAKLSKEDRRIFKEMGQQRWKNGKFQVLQDSFIVGDNQYTPFKERLIEIENSLIEKGMPEEVAKREALNIFKNEMGSIVEKKSDYRSGNNPFGRDFCQLETGQCISQQNLKLLGKRPSRGQLPRFFPDSYKIKQNLKNLRKEASIKGEEQPWSDDYWPIRKGILGFRYADKKSDLNNWKENLKYILQPEQHLTTLVEMAEGKEKQQLINALSPAEKYDLLIGNIEKDEYRSWFNWLNQPTYSKGMELNGMVAGTLSPNQWQQGQVYHDKYNEVESWMGICHGWATASVHMDRPLTAIEVVAFDGKTKIKFYPSDIKSLGSYLWAQSAPYSRFIGGRCNDKSVETDPTSGAIINEDCFDTNPADWHLVITNYLGEMERSFIMDATYNYAVWNQPVMSYEYRFFDVRKQNPNIVDSEQSAFVKWEDYKDQDPFVNVRETDSRRKWIVGVYMKVDYLGETRPSHKETNSFLEDRLIRVYYTYDLELDENFKVIGGEWHQKAHPDFLWTHDPGQKAVSRVEMFYADAIDKLLSKHYGYGPVKFDQKIPKDLTDYAKAAAERGESVAFIVESLFDWAQL